MPELTRLVKWTRVKLEHTESEQLHAAPVAELHLVLPLASLFYSSSKC